jgi:HD-like signal output (HDOD) protein
LLDAWGLPGSVTCAVRWHHQPGEATRHTRQVDLVYVANAVVHALGLGCGDQAVNGKPWPVAFARLRLDLNTAVQMVGDLAADVRPLRELAAA